MSASSKKKLRNQLEAEKMTERQLAEQKEAKKLKIYTIAFVVVLVALLVTAVTVGAVQTIRNGGMRERNTVAYTVGEHEISNAELNYFYIDTINNFYSQNSAYISLFLDTTTPLDQQIVDETTGETWADSFLTSAKATAKSVYAMNDAAIAAGHTMSEDEQASVDSTMSTMALYAGVYGYSDTETYLKKMYGPGASEESFRDYVEKSMLADSYYAAYGDSLTYDDAALREAEKENFNKYSSYTYNYYYLSASRFLEGGTTDENGETTYTDEETAASIAAAEEAAKQLTTAGITTTEALDAAIAALPINLGTTGAVSTYYADQSYTSVNSYIVDWISDASRKDGDITYIANIATGDEETISGYYVVLFHSANDNTFALKNVRHILVNFEGGTTDEYGTTTYTDEEKAAAKSAAEEILGEWKAGDASEDSFAALATLKSGDTGSVSTGGLYEDVHPGQMVPAFEDWCFDGSRKAGDTGIVETEYGYHVMYFVGDSDITYRDYQITNELTSNDLSAWYSAILENVTVADGDCSYIKTDITLG